MDLELRDMRKGKVFHEEVWCTRCKTEGHDKEQCPALRNYLNTGAPSPFNNNVLYYEIYRKTGQHRPRDFYFLQRYVQVAKNFYCKFCKSMGHNEELCCSFNLIMERTQDSYRVQDDAQGHDGYGYLGGWGNFRGCGCGGMLGRGQG